MIHFDSFTLANGLKVLVHEDKSTPMAVVNVIYNVGAKDESPEKTGFAHLFEHLMFGGSINIPEYDEPLQKAGGENNAFTTNDLTNYYCQLPAENIETAFWLESDRMLSLAFGKKSLEVQRKVVCEEFKEHYINKPYGDVWHKMRALAYTTHPYQWMTIGKELKHVEDATLEDVKGFFFKHYTPCNAILVVAGNITTEQVKLLTEKWFGSIPSGEKYQRSLPQEPKQTAPRKLEVKANVPLDAFYKCWHIYPRLDDRYYVADLITEIMSGGGSSRLYQSLVKEKQLFSNIECFHFGSTDAGLLAIEGKLVKGRQMQN
jgi:predicted Zn-dependent peptidase